tara:strand:- start:5000 stop:6385 length:1386 start_codon:yes stop_codon:yes gene_type:complete
MKYSFRNIPCIKILIFSLIVFNISCNKDGTNTVPEEEEEIIENKLPRFEIGTNGNTIVDEPKIDASIKIYEDDEISYEGKIGIEIRGATSQSFPKKSYGFETRDASNEDLNVSLLGYPEEEDWILYGPYSDKSLMRNMLIYDLSRDINRYASRTKFTELYINDVYKGVYVFMEKLKRDGDRIDINKLNDDENTGEDVTGGYILKIDKTSGSNLGDGYNDLNSFTSSYPPTGATMSQEIHFLYEYPDAEDITEEQKTYISSYVNQFEDALASNEYTNSETGYEAFIDVDSFIDFFLMNEMSNNVDGYRLSTYMHKDKNEKLKMGPIWDFNLAFGNADYCGGGETNVWAYKFNERCSGDYWEVPFWWGRLLEDPAYISRLKVRWNALRSNEFSDAAITLKIETYKEVLNKSGAINANFSTWDILGVYVWPNNFVGSTYNEETEYLENWITTRLLWLDQEINNL